MNFWPLQKKKPSTTQLMPNQFVTYQPPQIIANQSQPVYKYVPIITQAVPTTIDPVTCPPIHPTPSAPPLPDTHVDVPSELFQSELNQDEILSEIKYPLERELFTQLSEQEFGLYPAITHLAVLEMTQDTKEKNLPLIFMKLHLEIAAQADTNKSHCVHVRIKKDKQKYLLERVLANMTEADHLGYLSAKSTPK